jgi:hypothetical protein
MASAFFTRFGSSSYDSWFEKLYKNVDSKVLEEDLEKVRKDLQVPLYKLTPSDECKGFNLTTNNGYLGHEVDLSRERFLHRELQERKNTQKIHEQMEALGMFEP